MTPVSDRHRDAVLAWQRGDLAAALRLGDVAIAAAPGDAELLRFVGVLHCQDGNPRRAELLLRRAAACDPDDIVIRRDLAETLTMLGQLDEAARLCSLAVDDSAAGRALKRLRGYVFEAQGRLADAAQAYAATVTDAPDDFESWNNLGNAVRQLGDPAGAVAALQQAARLRPELAIIRLNLGAALADEGRSDEAAEAYLAAVAGDPQPRIVILEVARALARLGRGSAALPALTTAARAGDDAELELELGYAHVGLRAHADAEAAFRRALGVAPDFVPALVALGLLLEGANRLDELQALLDAASAIGVPARELVFLQALALARRGDLAAALELAKTAPPPPDPSRRAQLIGELSDRLNDTAAAFAAFTAMNRDAAAAHPGARAAAASYRDGLAAKTALLTRTWVDGWSAAAPRRSRPAPVFLLGFPRSGTTLIGTILAGHPGTLVLEEEPLVQRLSDALGNPASLADLDAVALSALRDRYFELLETSIAPVGDWLVIDKFPLSIAHTALIYRVFPDARFVFVERHPCDVVLSCYMQNFRLNPAVANFLDLRDTALTYDLVMAHWQTCRAMLPLAVHTLRYETLIDAFEPEVRKLLAFLDLPWLDTVTDHRASAARRGYIGSPSYAQVTEPIYRRAAGRWERYREQLEPVMPLLTPWLARLDYRG